MAACCAETGDAGIRRTRFSLALAVGMAALLGSPAVAVAQGDARLLAPPPRRAATGSTITSTITEPANSRPSLLAPPVRTAPAIQQNPASAATGISAPRDLTPSFSADSRSGLKVTKGTGVLPNDHGQVWREYDISPYTTRVDKVARPEQAIVDWIVRDTGTEAWFGEPLGILSAGSGTLRVYHTPEMQQKVREIVERFVATNSETHALGVRLATVGSPNWRARAISLLKPVDVKSPGVEAWLLSRENAVMLYEQLKQRGDFREHSPQRAEVVNGQSQTLSRTQPRSYNRGVQMKPAYPFYDLIPGKIDEGYSLTISPLMSLDGKTVEAAIECQVDQVEKLVPIAMDVPVGTQSQRVQVQVPQVVSWRLSERFRWPADEVLVLSCGVVANPAASTAGPLAMLNPLGGTGSRADALLMIEHRGAASETPKVSLPQGSAAAATPPAAAPAIAPIAPLPATAAPTVVPASAVSPFRRY
jgi:hypothetical protein